MTYFNENDPFAVGWLRALVRDGLVTDGTVDPRSIEELNGDELREYNRVHLFAGIAGWDLALQLAGWPADRPVWTGSCPCQPFSAAGKRKGQADERHLWPEMYRLIRECRPDTVFGEQVASAIGPGWLDGVFADLESEGYACGAVVLGAHSFGAPHIRQRLWWAADSGHAERRRTDDKRPAGESAAEREQEATQPGRRGAACWVANTDGRDAGPEREQRGRQQRLQPADGGVGGLAEPESAARQPDDRAIHGIQEPVRQGVADRLTGVGPRGSGWQPVMFQSDCDPDGDGWCRVRDIDPAECDCIGPTQDDCEYREFDGVLYGRLVLAGESRLERHAGDGDDRDQSGRNGAQPARHVATASDARWSDSVWHRCRDGKARRIPAEPLLFPLAYGIPHRVGLLRGAGNAIVPAVAAEFIRAFLEAEAEIVP